MFTTWGGQGEGRTNKHTKQSDYRGLPLPPEPSPLIIQLTLQTPIQVGMHGNTPLYLVIAQLRRNAYDFLSLLERQVRRDFFLVLKSRENVCRLYEASRAKGLAGDAIPTRYSNLFWSKVIGVHTMKEPPHDNTVTDIEDSASIKS